MSPSPTIGMVLFADVTQLDFTAPYEVFARIPGAKVHVIARMLDAVRSERGLCLLPDTTYETCPPLDVLFIPGGPGQVRAEQDETLMEFIRYYGKRNDVILASVCTGALLLGAAGLLRGKKATTHWTCMDILPLLGATAVDAPVVEDGNLITGAGVTNGLDFALRVAEKLAGTSAMQRIARAIEYPHSSQQADKAELARLSEELLAANPHRKARLEAAQRVAARLIRT